MKLDDVCLNTTLLLMHEPLKHSKLVKKKQFNFAKKVQIILKQGLTRPLFFITF